MSKYMPVSPELVESLISICTWYNHRPELEQLEQLRDQPKRCTWQHVEGNWYRFDCTGKRQEREHYAPEEYAACPYCQHPIEIKDT